MPDQCSSSKDAILNEGKHVILTALNVRKDVKRWRKSFSWGLRKTESFIAAWNIKGPKKLAALKQLFTVRQFLATTWWQSCFVPFVVYCISQVKWMYFVHLLGWKHTGCFHKSLLYCDLPFVVLRVTHFISQWCFSFPVFAAFRCISTGF